MFRENLWDVPSLQHCWVELLGLGEHNAFECVGEVDETRLAFEKCRLDGGKGQAMELFQKSFKPKSDSTGAVEGQQVIDYEELRKKFNHVYEVDHGQSSNRTSEETLLESVHISHPHRSSLSRFSAGIPSWIFDKVKVHMKRDA